MKGERDQKTGRLRGLPSSLIPHPFPRIPSVEAALMAQDPLHVLWVEPTFPGRLGAVADWLVRRRGYRAWFYCHNVDSRESWPPSVGQGLEVQVFGVGGVA